LLLYLAHPFFSNFTPHLGLPGFMFETIRRNPPRCYRSAFSLMFSFSLFFFPSFCFTVCSAPILMQSFLSSFYPKGSLSSERICFFLGSAEACPFPLPLWDVPPVRTTYVWSAPGVAHVLFFLVPTTRSPLPFFTSVFSVPSRRTDRLFFIEILIFLNRVFYPFSPLFLIYI